MYKVGLIGFSIGGQVFHAPFIAGHPELQLYKVTARKKEHQELLRARYPQAIAVGSAIDIFDDPEIDIVVIATSNDVHYDFAKAALLAGKHVVVEKPFTNTTEQADELISIAAQKNLLLTVHHNARFHSDYKTVRKLVEEHAVGRLTNYEARYDRFRNYLREGAWREQNLPGSGIHYDLGAHLIDQALQLFGAPTSVFADLRVQRDGAEAVDDFEIILSYPALKVSLKGQMLAKLPTPRYALYGTAGCFIKPGTDPQEEMLRSGSLPHLHADWGVEQESTYGTLAVEDPVKGDNIRKIRSERGSGQDFYANVVDVLQGKGVLIVRPEQARDVIRILALCEQSWNEKSVISLAGELIAYDGI
ncbi:Gfo/Idh/MocA family oxidoreductase [Sphingobacterium sp. lm-10]|uniref:Gfo/Idh/MocA family oxidoreductase n=1 Tax=Sphingobacterium sp. lm-10 TaxID=2944904 RepID=UPI0020224B64|nr:Gfo/Idh/MocA family oxidoreductase [Sphingobacterium sp. lm-10]MCL7986410.1 Gfo/Idh/MocA family oxidoreductase [Sphingobacterium sp. lm-10]